jgi:hypothetical protein
MKGGNVLRVLVLLYLKGRGLLWTGKQSDNYELIISISVKGFTWPMGPYVRWSVRRGRLGTSTVFSWVPRSSRCWGGWNSRRFLESVLWGTSFTWLLRVLDSVLPGAVLYCRCSRRWRLSGGTKPPGLDIWWSVECLGNYGPGTQSPLAWLPGAQACPEPGFEVGP